MRQGKLSEAEPYLREALEKSRRVQGEEHPDTLIALNQLGALLVAERKFTDAAQLLAPAEAATRKALTGDNADWLASMLMHLGQARAGLGEFAVAEGNLLEAQPLVVKIFGTKNVRTHKCTEALIDLYTSWNTAEPNKGYDIKAAEWKRRLQALIARPAPTTAH